MCVKVTLLVLKSYIAGVNAGVSVLVCASLAASGASAVAKCPLALACFGFFGVVWVLVSLRAGGLFAPNPRA